MRLLGLSCGEVEGSAEILLRQAMSAASDAAADLQIQLIRLNELRVPFGEALAGGDPPGDDAWWFWEALVQCDALIISAPIYARSIPGTLRLLGDRLLGPNADAAFVEELLALQRRGSAPAVPFRVDERVLKPRVAAFIAVGGSLTEHWKTLALPLMHSFTFSMHMAVVDQVVLAGAGTPRSIVLDEAALQRAARLGTNVGAQVGRPFAEAEYRGDPGLCPMCHLDVIELKSDGAVVCASCGAAGRLVGGAVEFSPEGREQSVITMAEKRAHFLGVQRTAGGHAERRDEIDARARALLDVSAALNPDRPALVCSQTRSP
jgi:multimeric flavodoxin WrbA